MDDEIKKYIDDKIQEIKKERSNGYRTIAKNIITMRNELVKLRKKINAIQIDIITRRKKKPD